MSDIFFKNLYPNKALHIEDAKDIGSVISHRRLRFPVEVKQPLVLISQIQRSGGTLISQLLDGHSELHVHPGELHIGRPNKYHWPDLDLDSSRADLFRSLFEKPTTEYVQYGYQKFSSAEASVDPNYRERVLPFIFDIHLQKKIFQGFLSEYKFCSQRDVLDCYVSSYFNAWLDYQGLYRNPMLVKYWVSFAAQLLTRPGNFERFIFDYPDGKAITILRNPISWFASAKRHSSEYDDVISAMSLWIESYKIILNILRQFPGKMLVLNFEDCISNTNEMMQCVAGFLGIKFECCMLKPTFNGLDIPSDSSFGSKLGLDKSATDRGQYVDSKTKEIIDKMTGSLYAELKELAFKHKSLYLPS